MSRNEIRLRRNRMSGQRFRNFGEVMERHEKYARLKKILRVFTMLMVILILVALIFYIMQVEKKISKGTSFHKEKYFKQKT
jgi:cell division septal protein FtsQ